MKRGSIGILLAASLLAAGADCPPAGKPGIWSRRAVYLCSTATATGFTRDIRVYSPDRLKAVRVIGESWYVEVGGREIRPAGKQSRVSFYLAEILWAPDSTAFSITQSDASSEINGFHTDIYRVEEHAVTRIDDINDVAMAQFTKNHECAGHDYNVGAVQWIDEKTILLVVELPSDSVCSPRQYFAGYTVSVPEAAVHKAYNPQQFFKIAAGDLGVRLKGDYNALTFKQRALAP